MSARAGTRGLFAIAGREVSERATLLALAAFVAVTPWLLPAALGDRPFLGVFLAIVMTATAAVLTGSSVIARDLAEGRLGFFLSRPIPWWSIWGGKWIAAIVLTFAAGAIASLPVLFLKDALPVGAGWWGAILAPSVLALIGGVHMMAVGYRSRSRWFALDLALAAGIAWMVARTPLMLAHWGVWAYDAESLSRCLWVLAVVLTLAAAAQVAWGGSDIQRGRHILSIAVWSLLLPVAALYVGWGAWVWRLAPADLGAIGYADASADGAWVAATGHARAPRPASLFATVIVDRATGRFIRLAGGGSLRPVFSDDSRHAAWIADAWSDEPQLFLADLESAHAAGVPIPLPVPPGTVLGLALSPDGRHAAAVQLEHASLFALGSAQVAVSVSGRPGPVAFSPDGRAHVLIHSSEVSQPGTLDVVVLDAAIRHPTVTGHIATRGHPLELWSPSAARVAVVHRLDFRPSLTLHDGLTGALLATLVPEGSAGRVAATFLHDGRLAVAEAGSSVRLRVFTPDGAETLSLDVAPRYAMARAVEVAPGVVAVELPFQDSRGSASSVLVDVTAGRVLRTERGLRPATAARSWWERGAASPPSSLFIDDHRALVRLDVATGARQTVLGGR
jgi:hypothetical protein